ncbi:MAG: hypothetical protein Q7T01_00895 [bacterium]|nr:hypothetical protein [bacterium]
MKKRTIGFHPCVGKKASGQSRPTSVVIRQPDGTHEAFELTEQQLLDFFTCGAVVAWRNAALADLPLPRPPHHLQWIEVEQEAYDGYEARDSARRDDERGQLFRIMQEGDEVTVLRAQVPERTVTLDPATDTVGVVNGGLGYQLMEVLLGRFPDMDFRVIGSTPLKELREAFDRLLPRAVQRKAEKVRAKATGEAPAEAEDDEEDGNDAPLTKSGAKDANAKFDAHRIAYALSDDTAAKHFMRCTLRHRDYASVTVAYHDLELARDARVAAEQQFRQAHRAEVRRLVQDPRVPYVTLASADEKDQRIEMLLATYQATLTISDASEQTIERKMQKLRRAHERIQNAAAFEEEMEANLERVLNALPEYTEFLPWLKEQVDPETGLFLGKYIGPRIFARWIVGFGAPLASRLQEPMRATDAERIAACKAALTEAIADIPRDGLPEQPAAGGGKTREWLLACERIAQEAGQSEQLAAVCTARDAYRKLVNAKKCAADRPLNRVIAFMGLHVRNGGKYAEVPKGLQFPRRRKGFTTNHNEKLMRQGAYQWMSGIIKRNDSYWKMRVYLPVKARIHASGTTKMKAHRTAFWRGATNGMRWVIRQWFAWERRRMGAAEAPNDIAHAA